MTISTHRNGVRTANTLMLSSWMGLVCVESKMIDFVSIVVRVYTLRANEKESKVFDTLLSLSQGKGRGGGQRESRPTDPTHRPEPTRPTDPTHRPDHPTRPDPQRQVQEMQADASGCKGAQPDARGCKRMQADASGKARRERVEGRRKGQGGRCPRQRAQKAKH